MEEKMAQARENFEEALVKMTEYLKGINWACVTDDDVLASRIPSLLASLHRVLYFDGSDVSNQPST